MLINSQWMSCDPHEAALASDWLIFFQIQVWLEQKVTPGKGEGKKDCKV